MDFETAEGVGLMASATELEEAYGDPTQARKVTRVTEGPQPGFGFCARFDAAPRRLFCFAPMRWAKDFDDWEDVRAEDATLSYVYLVAS